MKNKFILSSVLIVACFTSCKNERTTTLNDIKKISQNSFLKEDYFNINNSVKNDTIILEYRNERKLFLYDSLSRLIALETDPVQKIRFTYAPNISIPICKKFYGHIQRSYFSSSLILNDTISCYWMGEFSEVEDTSIYVFNDNRLTFSVNKKWDFSGNPKTFKHYTYYNDSIVILSTIEKGGTFSYLNADSTITTFKFVSNNRTKIHNITERFFFKERKNNYSNYYEYSDNGKLSKYIERDTMSYMIKM